MTAGVLAASAGNVRYSNQFVSASNQFLYMSKANFGSYNTAKFGISLWVKRSNTGGTYMLYNHTDGGTDRAFDMFFNSSDKLQFRCSENGSTLAGQLLTTATYTSTASFYHIVFTYDSANATAGDRMRLYVNGVEVTAFDTDTNPTAAVFTSSADICVGSQSNPVSSPYSGLIQQAALFSTTLPVAPTLYNGGSALPTLIGQAGLWSVQDTAGGVVTHDGQLASSWTNSGGVTASSVAA